MTLKYVFENIKNFENLKILNVTDNMIYYRNFIENAFNENKIPKEIKDEK